VTFDLGRFTRAQDGGGGSTALAELEAGRKRTHWIWYIFPQLAGLGRSPAAVEYGLRGVDEASAYLRDPVLRDRLLAVTNAVLTHLRRQPAPALSDLMGSEIDVLKLVSSMTLFREIATRVNDGEVAGLATAVLLAARLQGYEECGFTMRQLDAVHHRP
jgi:uncharacterized protein (DUF1810 family)